MSEAIQNLWRIAKPAFGLFAMLIIFRAVIGRKPFDGWPLLVLSFGMVLVGLFLFIAGALHGLVPLGSEAGSNAVFMKNKFLIVCMAFAIGLFSTLLEPGLRTLAAQVEEVTTGAFPQHKLIRVVSIGFAFGMALGIAVLVWGINPKPVLISGLYLLATLMLFVPGHIVGIALDCASATTGPLNIPLLVAFGAGLSQAVHGTDPLRHGFGLLGMTAVGTIGAVLLLGLFTAR